MLCLAYSETSIHLVYSFSAVHTHMDRPNSASLVCSFLGLSSLMCLFLFFRFFVQFSYFFSGFLRVFCVLLWFSSFVFHQFLFVSFLIFLRFFISHFPLIFVFLFLMGFSFLYWFSLFSILLHFFPLVLFFAFLLFPLFLFNFHDFFFRFSYYIFCICQKYF